MGRARSTIGPDDLRLLARSAFFGALSAVARARLVRAAEVVVVPRDTALWRRGRRHPYVYVVLSGRVGLVDAADDGTTVIDVFPPGSVIGGGSTLHKTPFPFSGRTVDEVRLLRVSAARFRRWLHADHSVALATIREVMESLRRLTVSVRDLKQLSANQRLGYYLLSLAAKAGHGREVRLTDDLELMARILGTTRESLSRSFAKLRRYGVTKRAKLVSIASLARLRRYCDAGQRR